MASERGISNAVNQPRMLPDEVFECFIVTALLTARYRASLAQDCLSRHQSLNLIHEDRRGGWFVQIFLERDAGALLPGKQISSKKTIRDRRERKS